jgi:hypothetical protein
MNKTDWENKSLVHIVLIGFIFNLLLGWWGALYPHISMEQTVLFQLGNAFAISASVMAARYTGLKGQQVAASAYILLGITHGISLAALSKDGINADREATMAMPMIPALVFMLWCNLFPKWLRIAGLIPSMFFLIVYVTVHTGGSFHGWILYSGYATLQITEMLWGIYLYKDWKNGSAA